MGTISIQRDCKLLVGERKGHEVQKEEDGMPFEGRGRATQQQQSGLWTGKPVLVHTVCSLAGDGWPGSTS